MVLDDRVVLNEELWCLFKSLEKTHRPFPTKFTMERELKMKSLPRKEDFVLRPSNFILCVNSSYAEVSSLTVPRDSCSQNHLRWSFRAGSAEGQVPIFKVCVEATARFFDRTYSYLGQFGPSFCINETLIPRAKVARGRNNGFSLVLAHSYTIIYPTIVEKGCFQALLSLLSIKEETLRDKSG